MQIVDWDRNTGCWEALGEQKKVDKWDKRGLPAERAAMAMSTAMGGETLQTTRGMDWTVDGCWKQQQLVLS